jgi:hypothetical protein
MVSCWIDSPCDLPARSWIKHAVWITVVATLQPFARSRNMKHVSTGKQGVRDASQRSIIPGESHRVRRRPVLFHTFRARGRLTFSELLETPPFPLERLDFPVERLLGHERHHARSHLCTRDSQGIVRVSVGSQAS